MKVKSFSFLFYDNKILVKKGEKGISIPSFELIEALDIKILSECYIGTLKGASYYTSELRDLKEIPNGMKFLGLKDLFNFFDEDLMKIASIASQVINWNKSYRYCGKCGSPTVNKKYERAKICPKCGLTNYPRLSPAMIVAVTKGDSLLLARAKNFRSNYYSVLAGFVEPGESLEECVMREVKEEVNINIKNIKYFGSQPWPFPDVLMVAFTAEYDSGDISVSQLELVDANWFTVDQFPPTPGKHSIAGQLINWFVEKEKKNEFKI